MTAVGNTSAAVLTLVCAGTVLVIDELVVVVALSLDEPVWVIADTEVGAALLL